MIGERLQFAQVLLWVRWALSKIRSSTLTLHEISWNSILVCLSKSWVLSVSIQSHNLMIYIVLAQSNQSLPICLPSRLLAISSIFSCQSEMMSLRPFTRFWYFWCEIKLEGLRLLKRFQMLNCIRRHWLPMPIQIVLDFLDVLPLEGFGQNNLRLILGVSALCFSILIITFSMASAKAVILCPSTLMTLHPKASNHFLYTSMSCPMDVSCDCPNRLMSRMAVRLSSL